MLETLPTIIAFKELIMARTRLLNYSVSFCLTILSSMKSRYILREEVTIIEEMR